MAEANTAALNFLGDVAEEALARKLVPAWASALVELSGATDLDLQGLETALFSAWHRYKRGLNLNVLLLHLRSSTDADSPWVSALARIAAQYTAWLTMAPPPANGADLRVIDTDELHDESRRVAQILVQACWIREAFECPEPGHYLLEEAWAWRHPRHTAQMASPMVASMASHNSKLGLVLQSARDTDHSPWLSTVFEAADLWFWGYMVPDHASWSKTHTQFAPLLAPQIVVQSDLAAFKQVSAQMVESVLGNTHMKIFMKRSTEEFAPRSPSFEAIALAKALLPKIRSRAFAVIRPDGIQGVFQAVMDPLTYAALTPKPEEVFEYRKLVQSGLSPLEAIAQLAQKSNKP